MRGGMKKPPRGLRGGMGSTHDYQLGKMRLIKGPPLFIIL